MNEEVLAHCGPLRQKKKYWFKKIKPFCNEQKIEESPWKIFVFQSGNALFYSYFCVFEGTAVAQWLRCCAKNRKVAGSIPDGVIGIFH